MIRIGRTKLEAALQKKLDDYTAEIKGYLDIGEDPPKKLIAKYGDIKELKELLARETYGKCAYCESRVLHIDFGDIEHIKPKSVYPEFAISYDNLTLACGYCNTKKSNNLAAIVNPRGELEPLDEIVFDSHDIDEDFCGDAGLLTLDLLELNRAELSGQRAQVYAHLKKKYKEWKKAPAEPPQLKQAHLWRLWAFAHPSQEYSAMCLTALSRWGVPPDPKGRVQAYVPSVFRNQ